MARSKVSLEEDSVRLPVFFRCRLQRMAFFGMFRLDESVLYQRFSLGIRTPKPLSNEKYTILSHMIRNRRFILESADKAFRVVSKRLIARHTKLRCI